MEALNLGQRVRELRNSTLSKIENEPMWPTFQAVTKIAKALDISIPQLVTPRKSDTLIARRAITRAGEGMAHPTATDEHETLAAELRANRMLRTAPTIRAGEFAEFDGWVRHDAEEFLNVLSRAIEFYAPLRPRRGDSAHYDATRGHNVIAVSEDDAAIPWETSLA